jgi:hypothetical protein
MVAGRAFQDGAIPPEFVVTTIRAFRPFWPSDPYQISNTGFFRMEKLLKLELVGGEWEL